MKKRTPNTVEDAITIILADLGPEICETLLQKSASLVRKWSDPDIDALPNIHQAMVLDTQHMMMHGTAPIFEVYKRAVANLSEKYGRVPEQRLSDIMLRATAALGELAGTVSKFTDHNSDGGADLSPNERISLLEMQKQLERQMAALSLAITNGPVN